MGETLEFASDGGFCPGYAARPAGGRGPGVVVIQEYWGLVTHVKDVCDRFAQEGFVALAPDLYHGAVATEPDEAGKLAMGLRIDDAARDMAAAVTWLRAADASSNGVGIVGFCMGGALALLAASRTPHVAATVAFYPPLGMPAVQGLDTAGITGAVLCHFATEDHASTPEQVREFERRLDEAGVPAEVHWYEGAGHAFFNDTRAEAYRAEAARRAWTRTLSFLRAHLATTPAPVG
jgi:carboxymethylenebutenolidase